MSGNAFRGVSAEQDARFSDKEKKLLKQMKFPAEFKLKPDLSKVNWESMKIWIEKRLTEILGGVEDDVLIGYVIEQLEGKKSVDPCLFQINLTGFLENNTAAFCKELWDLLISASKNPSGIPQKFLDEKAAELRQRNAERDNLRRQREEERSRRQFRHRRSHDSDDDDDGDHRRGRGRGLSGGGDRSPAHYPRESSYRGRSRSRSREERRPHHNDRRYSRSRSRDSDRYRRRRHYSRSPPPRSRSASRELRNERRAERHQYVRGSPRYDE